MKRQIQKMHRLGWTVVIGPNLIDETQVDVHAVYTSEKGSDRSGETTPVYGEFREIEVLLDHTLGEVGKSENASRKESA